jgi:hypothetical protein
MLGSHSRHWLQPSARMLCATKPAKNLKQTCQTRTLRNKHTPKERTARAKKASDAAVAATEEKAPEHEARST